MAVIIHDASHTAPLHLISSTQASRWDRIFSRVKTNLIKRRINRRKTGGGGWSGRASRYWSRSRLMSCLSSGLNTAARPAVHHQQACTSVRPASKACNIGANKAVSCRSGADPAAAAAAAAAGHSVFKGRDLCDAVKWTSHHLSAVTRCYLRLNRRLHLTLQEHKTRMELTKREKLLVLLQLCNVNNTGKVMENVDYADAWMMLWSRRTFADAWLSK